MYIAILNQHFFFQADPDLKCLDYEDILNILETPDSRVNEYFMFRFIYRWSELHGKRYTSYVVHYSHFTCNLIYFMEVAYFYF